MESRPAAGKSLLVRLAEVLARCVYRVKVIGAEHLPAGGCLLLPNHLTWVDAIVLQVACPRPIRFVVFEGIYRQPLLNPLFRILQAIPISQRKARDAVREAVDAIRSGEVVCVFPEGELSRNGILLRLKRGYELIAREADAPVVPVWLDQLWGSIFSFAGGKYFKKIPKKVPYPVTVAFGEPMTPGEADIGAVRQRLLDLGEFCYERRPLLKSHLAAAAVAGLRKHQFDTALIDGMDGSSLSRGTLLAVALALSRHLKATCPDNRVSVVLPPGKAGVIANLAVVLAGKVPVNLNFTAGRSALEAANRIAGLRCAITAQAVQKRFTDIPWPENVIHLDKLIPQLKPKIPLWRAVVAVTPARLLCALLGIPTKGDREEAVVLFTSGSSGEPKGVVLSHRNILGNVSQFGTMLNLRREDTLLAVLPLFHSFGCTVTIWYPVVLGVRMVTYPSPLEVAKNAELIERYSITMLLATPTFLRGYLRKATPEQLRSLELVVTGAEKLPRDLAEAFEKKFGKAVMEGYGLTETAPVASVNLPEPAKPRPEDTVQPSSRPGSVGKLAPGMTARIREPDSGDSLSLHSSGMLWLRGPNIFEGYLNDEKRTADVLHDGWFKTGDLGRFDEDGFLYIEGRLSRFSKIGGEMVPHETVETRISQVLGLESHDERVIAIVGVPDEAKGEALILLSACEIDLAALRGKLNDTGIPNLWIPRKIMPVEKIPVLGSGKLDLKACRELAGGPQK